MQISLNTPVNPNFVHLDKKHTNMVIIDNVNKQNRSNILLTPFRKNNPST